MKEHILLVEDELGIALPLGDRLRAEGYRVEHAADGQLAFDRAMQTAFDVILLDVMLPGISGLEVCELLRKRGIATPILMLTARGETADKVAGLKTGADDYLTKPFEHDELLARIEALLRRSGGAARETVYEAGDLRIDLRKAEVTRKGRAIPFSAREFQLLRYFIEHQGALLTREQLLRDVWNYDPSTSTRTVDVHVGLLRQKVEDDVKNPRRIITVIGLGYKFVETNATL